MSAFAEGKEAFETDVPLANNPYARDAGQWLQWRIGWLTANWQANDSSQGGE